MQRIEFDSKLERFGIELLIGEVRLHNFRILTPHYDLSPIFSPIITQVKSEFTIHNIKEQPPIALFRSFYWQKLGIDPTKIRPAAEALIRRILSDKAIPKISPFVDAYNWASIRSFIPMGAYDLSAITLPIHIRLTTEGEEFIPIGKDSIFLPPHTLVTSDSTGQILCQYPYRDAQPSMIRENSTDIVLLAYGIKGILQESIEDSLDLAAEHLFWLQSQGVISFQIEPTEIHTNI